ncbi:hypothetical protein CIPAW_01G096400 [Carya illinoinensis]|uniref:PGG domain-containing protein n=1 Tax=Carya illinoinensis TaxID=32201 RepID=A0A8T1RL39_CARIL|nr:hypothetical protein CIPAW_01G096400 [Carya illinoinensis]
MSFQASSLSTQSRRHRQQNLARRLNMPINMLSSTIVLEVLRNDNYANWSACIKNYFLAQDLWDIFGTTKPSESKDCEVELKAWKKKNAAALHAIQISCSVEILSQINHINCAKTVWARLHKLMTQPPSKGVNPVAEQRNSSNTPSSDIHEDEDRSTIAPDQKVEAGSYPGKQTEIKRRSPDYYSTHYAELRKALQSGDWNICAKEFLKLQPYSMSTDKITTTGKTALHVSVEAVHLHIVKELVELMSEDDLEVKDNYDNTALMLTTYSGQYKMAELMLRKNKKLVSRGTVHYGRRTLPVVNAISNGHIKMARYFYSLNPPEDLSPEKDNNGSTLCTQAIYAGALDIALDLIQKYPDLALAPDRSEKYSPIFALASMPAAFPSGNPLVFRKELIYSRIPTQLKNGTNEVQLRIQEDEGRQSNEVKTNRSSVRCLLSWPFSKLIQLLDIEHLKEMKLVHEQSRLLLNLMCEEIVKSDPEKRNKGNVNAAIFRAIKKGAFEFVRDVLKKNPDLLCSKDGNSRNIFSYAVLCRQAKIFSLINGIDIKNKMANEKDPSWNNILHIAGMPPAYNMLDRIPGAALQMQRELQWFKEVESIAHKKIKEFVNKDGVTPWELFTKNHKDLMKEAFTVPGGNNQDTGLPIFFNKKLFRIFIVSDALSLFSSASSVLMFLGILTSRYAEEDFFKSLPTKMIIGLSTLFFSIATMMIAFSAGLLLMLREESRMVIPVISLASIPVTLFVLMQFPLLVDMCISTYGPSIFNRKMKRWL